MTPSGVNTATGEYCVQYRETDIAIPGPTTLGFGRYYASYLEAAGVPASRLGTNWRGTFDWLLIVTAGEARVLDPRGRSVRFQEIATGWKLLEPTYLPFQLVVDGSHFLFLDAPSQRAYRFDAAGSLTRIDDERGTIFTLTYGPGGGPLSRAEDGLGRVLDFSYDASGHLASVTDGVRTVRYTYTRDLLTSFEDAAGRVTTYAYAAPAVLPGLLQSITEPRGNARSTQTYDPSGRVAQNVGADGHVETFSYLPPGTTSRVTEWTDRDLQTWTITHEILHSLGAMNRVTGVMEPPGGSWSFGYDGAGRPSGFTRPSGAAISVTNDPSSGRPNQIFRPGGSLGLALTWTPTPGPIVYHHLTGATYPDGTTESYSYDGSGNLTRIVDRGGFSWTWTYASRGMPLTYTNAAGGITNLTYNAALDLTGFSDGAITISNITYDEHHRVTSYQWADGSTRAFTYDDRNLPTGFRNEESVWNFHVWNENGLLASSTDGHGHTTQYRYDLMDRLTGVTDPLGATVTIGRDRLGRPTSITDRSGRTTSYTYDALSRLVRAVDPGLDQTLYTYDPDGRLLSETDPLSHRRGWMWDALDRVTQSTDGLGESEQYGYNVMDRLTSVLGPLEFSLTLGRDTRDLVTLYQVSTLGVGLVRHALGGITQSTDPDGKVWATARDANGRITSTTDPLARTATYEYDARGRLFRITRGGIEEERIFDSIGRVTAVNHTGGPALTFGYDAANRLISATGIALGYDNADRIMASNGLTFTRDAEGRVLTQTYAPGKTVTYTYDARGLLESASDWIGGSTTFAYDAAGRLTGLTRPNGTTTIYQYDAADRLIQKVEAQPGPQQSPLASVAITRDPLGRVAQAERRAPLMPGVTETGATAWSYDDASQNTALTYDALGRVTSDGVRTYTWDGASRLASYTVGSFTASFTYDAFGRILTRSEGAATTHTYVWNYGPPGATIDVDRRSPANPSDALYFVRTPSGGLLHSIDGPTNERRFYHYDEHGSTIFLTNDGGSVVTSYAYTPLGEKIGIGQTAGNPFTFQGFQGTFELAPPSAPSGSLPPGEEDPNLYLWAPGNLPYDAKRGLWLDPAAARRPGWHGDPVSAAAGEVMNRTLFGAPPLGFRTSPYLFSVNAVGAAAPTTWHVNVGVGEGSPTMWHELHPTLAAPALLGMVLGVDKTLVRLGERADPESEMGGDMENINISRPVSGTFRPRLRCPCEWPGWRNPGPSQTPGWKNPGPQQTSVALFNWSTQNLPLIGSISVGVTIVPPTPAGGWLTIKDQWGRRSNSWPFSTR